MRGKEILNKKEYGLLIRLMNKHNNLFIKPGSENLIFAHVCDRTLWYHKVEEQLRTAWLTEGRGSLGCLPTLYDRTSIYRARIALEKRGVLSFKKTGATNRAPLIVRIELPGIVRIFRDVFSRLMAIDDTAFSVVSGLQTIVTKVEKHWNKMSWPVYRITLLKEAMVKLDTVFERGKEKSDGALKKRNQKREAVAIEDIKPNWLPGMMKNYCGEAGARYVESLLTLKERKMMLGSARNFLTYCKMDEIDPRELLHDVCRWWHMMQPGLKSFETGKNVMLPRAVSFMSFFRYRREIVDWLAEPENKKDRYNVVILNKKRGERLAV